MLDSDSLGFLDFGHHLGHLRGVQTGTGAWLAAPRSSTCPLLFLLGHFLFNVFAELLEGVEQVVCGLGRVRLRVNHEELDDLVFLIIQFFHVLLESCKDLFCLLANLGDIRNEGVRVIPGLGQLLDGARDRPKAAIHLSQLAFNTRQVGGLGVEDLNFLTELVFEARIFLANLLHDEFEE